MITNEAWPRPFRSLPDPRPDPRPDPSRPVFGRLRLGHFLRLTVAMPCVVGAQHHLGSAKDGGTEVPWIDRSTAGWFSNVFMWLYHGFRHGLKANKSDSYRLKMTSNFDQVFLGFPPISDGIGRLTLFIGFARGTSKEFLTQLPPPKKKRATSMALPCPSQVVTRHHMDIRLEVSCSRIARLFHVAWLQGQAIHLVSHGWKASHTSMIFPATTDFGHFPAHVGFSPLRVDEIDVPKCTKMYQNVPKCTKVVLKKS